MFLILTVCLTGMPAICHDEILAVPDGAPALACVLGGQDAFAAWSVLHPGYRLRHWRCSSNPERRA